MNNINDNYNYNNSNTVANNSSRFDCENRNMNFNDSENNSIITNNIMNKSNGKMMIIV